MISIDRSIDQHTHALRLSKHTQSSVYIVCRLYSPRPPGRNRQPHLTCALFVCMSFLINALQLHAVSLANRYISSHLYILPSVYIYKYTYPIYQSIDYLLLTTAATACIRLSSLHWYIQSKAKPRHQVSKSIIARVCVRACVCKFIIYYCDHDQLHLSCISSVNMFSLLLASSLLIAWCMYICCMYASARAARCCCWQSMRCALMRHACLQ